MVISSLFHIVSRADWTAHTGTEWRPPSLAEVGFIHLSFRYQIPHVLRTFYGGADGLVVLELLPHLCGAKVVLEPGSGGETDERGRPELFPHLYGALPVAAVVAVHEASVMVAVPLDSSPSAS